MSCRECFHNDTCYMLKVISDTVAGDHFFGSVENVFAVCHHYVEAGQLPESRMPLSNEGQAQAAPEMPE